MSALPKFLAKGPPTLPLTGGALRLETPSSRLAQMYAALSASNEAILRASTQEELFQWVCDAAVHGSRFSNATIILADGDRDYIAVAASSGITTTYYKGTRISVDANLPEGRGTIGTAFRTQKPCVSNDFLNDPNLAPWHKQARKIGWNSVATFPLMQRGKSIGVFGFNSFETNAFDDEVLVFLQRVVENVSFALENFLRNEERLQDERRLKESEEKLRLSEERLKLLIDSVPASIVYLDTNERYTFCNRTFTDLVGLPEEWILGRTVTELFGEEQHLELQPKLQEMAQGRNMHFERQQRRPDGSVRDIAVTLVPHITENGQLVGSYGLALDITERKALEHKLKHMAQHDGLTGLPNRALFEDRLAQTVARGRRSNARFSVMYLDIDHFKSVNDSHGHGVGDELLKAFAVRLRACIRESDTAARLGGDEFAVILSDLAKGEDAAFIAQKIVMAMRPPFELPGFILSITTSVGVVLSDSGGADAAIFVAQADRALYQAKANGRNTYRIFGE